MNNRERDKLDIVSTDSVILEDSPVIEVEPEQLELSHGGGLSVIIKHDYYANDTAHGRDLFRELKNLGNFRNGELILKSL